jgi:hypothetical protein
LTLEKFYSLNAQLTGKKWLAKIGERSEQKANFYLSLFNFLYFYCFVKADFTIAKPISPNIAPVILSM